ncbi:hypothetical protein DFH08DRAFT_940739 [Mycena albidolilacea]|uniref:Uncharacterized protein n=1 Tax=Mycena albidolilacea TaxID=1033008 RepID=A0AAD7EJ23_9AGAR|nr:hypothetical protein DFH08DRAFT_940739 [Mycena albidolilacea]
MDVCHGSISASLSPGRSFAIFASVVSSGLREEVSNHPSPSTGLTLLNPPKEEWNDIDRKPCKTVVSVGHISNKSPRTSVPHKLPKQHGWSKQPDRPAGTQGPQVYETHESIEKETGMGPHSGRRPTEKAIAARHSGAEFSIGDALRARLVPFSAICHYMFGVIEQKSPVQHVLPPSQFSAAEMQPVCLSSRVELPNGDLVSDGSNMERVDIILGVSGSTSTAKGTRRGPASRTSMIITSPVEEYRRRSTRTLVESRNWSVVEAEVDASETQNCRDTAQQRK